MKNIIVVICALTLISWVLYNNNIGWTIGCWEATAYGYFAHIAFGLGLAAFWSMFLKEEGTLFMSFLCIIGWEIYEMVFFEAPIDTTLDIVLGISFALVYLKWTKKPK